MSSLRGAVPALFTLFFCAALVSCKKGDGQAEIATLRIAIAEPSSLDPAFLQGNNDFQVAANVHRAPFAWDAGRAAVRPDLCISHTHSEDLKVWTLTLDPDAHFSDGSQITAHDLVHSWRRIVIPETASPGADALAIIKGATDCTAGGKCRFGARAVAPHVVEMTLESPQPFLPELLASPRFAPVPAGKGLEPGELADNRTGPTSGPYMVKEWVPRQSLTLEMNPHFSKGEALPFESVVLRFTQSEESALAWWKTGEVDIVVGLVPLARVAALKEKFGRQVVVRPMRSVFYFMFNMSRPPMNSLKVRAVLSAAIDRKRLVDFVLRSGQTAAAAFVPDVYRKTAGFTPVPCSLLTGDQNKTDTFLSAEETKAVSGAELVFNSGETLKAIAEFTQQSIKQTAGVFVTLQPMEWKSFLALLKKRDFQMARYSLTGGPDPVDFFDNFTSGHPNNIAGYENRHYDNLVALAHSTADRNARFSVLQEAHGLLCRDLPAAPVYFSSQVHLARESFLTGFQPSPEGIFMWADLL